jgi:hypothetical protein
MTARLRIVVLLALCILPATAILGVRAEPTDVESVHAAYVINFIRYTRWAGPESPEPFVIAVLGPPESAAALRQLASRSGRVQGHPLRVRLLPVNTVAPGRAQAVRTLKAQLDDARIVYVAASHRGWDDAVVAAVAGRPVLTVGVGGDFIAAGGMFALFETQGRVAFSANEDAIRRASLDVSARVLVLARPAPAGMGGS